MVDASFTGLINIGGLGTDLEHVSGTLMLTYTFIPAVATVVPEPISIVLFGTGFAAVSLRRFPR